MYIAGKISGEKEYKDKFEAAAEWLTTHGYCVMQPAILPKGKWSYDAYMSISEAMLDACDAVAILDDWKKSRGAMYELGRCLATGKPYAFFTLLKNGMADFSSPWAKEDKAPQLQCDVCGKEFDAVADICPYCGAKRGI